MAVEIKAWKPSCCNRAYMSKGSAVRHERNCPKNPVNQACQTCIFLMVDYNTVYNPYHNGIPGSTDYEIEYWWCKKLGRCIRTYPDGNSILPKKHCELWKHRSTKDEEEDCGEK